MYVRIMELIQNGVIGMAEKNNVIIQFPKTVDMSEIAQILENAFETHGIESYEVEYKSAKQGG